MKKSLQGQTVLAKVCRMVEGAQAAYLCHCLVRVNEGCIIHPFSAGWKEKVEAGLKFRFKIRATQGIWWCVSTF